MNLKTFAIHQKLNNADDNLLKYVTKNEPVPISVLEQSFDKVLYPLQDEFAEKLNDDYMGALNKTVPLIVTVLPSGGYDISGEIPDNVMETVALVHNVDENNIVSSLVNHQLTSVYNKSCDITDLSINKSEEGGKVFTTDLTTNSIDEGKVKTAESVDEVVVDEPVVDDIFAEEPIEDLRQAPVEDFVEEPVPEPVEDIVEEPVFEAAAEPVNEETERQRQVAEAMRRIYAKFCHDIVEYKLDERLNLNL